MKTFIILDACVLYPAALRDTLLRAAAAGLYRPLWSAEILEEVRRNLVEKGKDADRIQHLIDTFRKEFPEAEVSHYQHLTATMPNDPKDRHVLVAAVASGAALIVTANLRDFPATALAPYHVTAQSPDDFLTSLFVAHPGVMTRVIVAQAGDLRNPPQTPQYVLTKLALHAPTFAARVQQALDE